MFRLGLIRYLVQNTSQVSITQECTKFTKGFHYRTVTTRVKENKHENIITSNLKPASQYSYAVNQQTEQEFLIRLKNDPDVFGDSVEKDIYDEKDLEEEKYFQNQPSPSQKLRIKQYADIIKAFIRKRQIKEAIDVLEVKMLQEDRVKPENYIFNLLVGACGRVGYTKKAFSLYNQMKKRGLKVTSSTYTALFNACSNSPWPEDGLNRALHLRNIMMEKMYEPNETNYNAMIKAFGRCGDLSTAFSLVDEMESKNLQIKDDTINFVLQACIQDKEAGFRHALLVWRKLVDKNINPTFYTYNLMLRCIRDCGIGTVEVMSDTLNKIFKQKVLQLDSRHNKILPSNTNYEQTESAVIEDKLSFNENTRPNLMARIPHLGNIISLAEIKKPEDRLLLVGSCRGFLNNMMENNCTPDIKTFTQLLDCLPGSLLAEKELMRAMKKLNVKPDIDFFNMLIKKRSMRFDYDSAKEVLSEMKKLKYRPNLMTYGVLSLGCKTKEEGLELLGEMKQHSYRLNTEILGAMLHQACYHRNFSYILELMEISLREDVKPNKKFMKCLTDFKKKCKDISNDKENKLSQNILFQKGFRIFQMRYKTWLEEIEIENSEEIHPWTQFRETTETDTRRYEDKSVRFKARHLSHFKVKTSKKHREK